MAFIPATGGVIQSLSDTTELVEMFKPSGLYLKPTARLNISVKLPLLKDPGQAISNWDLMERIKKLIFPIHFASIKVSKSTMEFVRFEAEVNNREHLGKAIKLIDNATLKVIGFFETLKVRAAEAKSDFPVRHDWDAFFRDAKNMNELHPGERPDTIYLAYLPCRWFMDAKLNRDKGKDLPSEFILRRIFETFGEVRCVDIPMTDPFRAQMSRTGMRCTGFRFGGEVTFEAYIQFNEYISFVKAMDALKNMKLVHVDPVGKASAASIKVDFDKSKHLSDKSIRRRRLERERLAKIDSERKAREAAEKAMIEEKLAAEEKEKTGRRRQREEKRKIRYLERRREEEEKAIERKILLEERKLVVAERKLESMRLLAELLHRVNDVKAKEEGEKGLVEDDEEAAKEKLQAEETKRRKRLLKKREKALRKKVAKKYKEDQEAKSEEEGRVRKAKKRVHSYDDLQSVVASSTLYSYRPRLRYEDEMDLASDYRDYQRLDEHRFNERTSPMRPGSQGKDVYLSKRHGYAGWRNLEKDSPPRRQKRRSRSRSPVRTRSMSRSPMRMRSMSPPPRRPLPAPRLPLPPRDPSKDYSDRWMDVMRLPMPKGMGEEQPSIIHTGSVGASVGIRETARSLKMKGQAGKGAEPGEVPGADFDTQLAQYKSMRATSKGHP